GPDARTGGMGEVGVALPDDMNAQHWNAAKYAFSKSKLGVSATYSPWLAGLGLGLQDIYMAYLAGHMKLSSLDAISMSLTYFSLGEMDITDYDGATIFENVKPHEFALDAAYSRKLTDNFSMAVTGRFIYSNLTTVSNNSNNTNGLKPGLAGAADVSLFYQTELKANNLYKSLIGAGMTISNIGNKISYSDDMEKNFLPANFRLGVAYTMYVDKYNKLTFEVDVNKLLVPSMVSYRNDTVNGKVTKVVDQAETMITAKDPRDVSVIDALYRSWFDAPAVSARSWMSTSSIWVWSTPTTTSSRCVAVTSMRQRVRAPVSISLSVPASATALSTLTPPISRCFLLTAFPEPIL
ncbi:MAG: type IX secretion system outer membrane channel protein PorV, partial [Bacteroidales bacterium]|nr:type IX secretion system outer membrane channel protein PorV [Bacteroidales bacterium]